MKMAQKMVEIAEAEKGVEEVGNTNCGVRVNEYKSTTWLDETKAWPWCAAFVDWCVMQAMETDGPYTFKRPRTAGAWALEDWSLEQDASTNTKKRPGRDIKAGDIVIFRISHVGIALSSVRESGYVSTVEGNTNAAGSREGQGVFTKARRYTEFKTRIRFTV